MAGKILNLYCGIGGNRKLWSGYDVTSIEYNPEIAELYSKLHPNDELIIGDAHEYLRENFSNFDFIWSSPPCQTHSGMCIATRHKNRKFPAMELYEEIIFLKHYFKGKWIVENVKPFYKPLIEPTNKIGRHFFWSNFNFPEIDYPQIDKFIMQGSTSAKQKVMDWLGIHYEGNIYYEGNHDPVQVLRNAVHPKVGKHIFDHMVDDSTLTNEPRLYR